MRFFAIACLILAVSATRLEQEVEQQEMIEEADQDDEQEGELVDLEEQDEDEKVVLPRELSRKLPTTLLETGDKWVFRRF